MAENEKYVDGLTEAESEDMAIIVNKTINEICLFSDKHNFDRDNMLKYYTELISAFTEIATIQGFEAENPQTNANRIRNMSDEELAELITGISKHCLAGIGECDCSAYNTCQNCNVEVKKWLQSEAE